MSRDYILRRWSFWEPTCTDDGQPGVIPSIGITATVLLHSKTPKLAQNEIQHKLAQFQPSDCSGGKTEEIPSKIENIPIGPLTLSTDIFSVRQRIMYTMSWLDDDEKPPTLPYFLYDKAEFPILTILPAQLFAESELKVSLETLADSVVIIGGSYYEGRDLHQTPLGLMPGALVLINAIHSLLQYKDIKPLPFIGKLLIITTLILLMSIFFLCVDSFWLGQFLNFMILFVLLPMSMILFPYGIWLDFATPLVLVELYQIAVFVLVVILCFLLSIPYWIKRQR